MSDGTPLVPFWTGTKAWGEGGGVGSLYDLLAQSDFLLNVLEDDFRGDALRDFYPAAKTNGTSAAVTFTEHNLGGYLDLTTGTDNAGYAGQGVGLQWSGDRGLLAEFLFQTPSSLADFKLEVGVTDADDDAGAVNAKVTPTVTATDCAVICIDTASGASTLSLVHAKGGTAAAVDFVTTLAVSTLYYAAIRVDGDNVKAMIRGLYTAAGTPSAEEVVANAVAGAGIEGGSALTPWMFAQARAGSASKSLQWHKWRVTEPAY